MQLLRTGFLAPVAALLCFAPAAFSLQSAGGEGRLSWSAKKGNLFYATWKFSSVSKSDEKSGRYSLGETRQVEMEWTALGDIQGSGQMSVRILEVLWTASNNLYEVKLTYLEGEDFETSIRQKAKEDKYSPVPVKTRAEQQLENMKRCVKSVYTVRIASNGAVVVSTGSGFSSDGLFQGIFQALSPAVPTQGFDPEKGWVVPANELPVELAQLNDPEKPYMYKVDHDPGSETKIELEISGKFPTRTSPSLTVTGGGQFSSKTVFASNGYLAESVRKSVKTTVRKAKSRDGELTVKTEQQEVEELVIDQGPAPKKRSKPGSRRAEAQAKRKQLDLAQARGLVLQYVVENKDKLKGRELKFEIGHFGGSKTVLEDITDKEVTLGITIGTGKASTPLPISGVTNDNLLQLLRMIIRKPEGELGEAAGMLKSGGE